MQNNITSNTIHTSSLQTQTGCDSIIFTELAVIPLYNINESASICSGSNFIFPDGFVQNNITTTAIHVSALQSSLGCDSTITTTVNINQNPNIMVNATQTVVCAGASVTLNGVGAATYTWSNGITDGVAFTPTADQTYTVTGTDLNNCFSSTTITINVNALPIVTFSSLGFSDTVCISSGLQTFGSGSPTGGVYSGAGVSGVQFDPHSAGVGVHIITYGYTDVNLCTNSATHNVTVDSCNTMGLLKQLNSADHLIIYPNPGNGNFTIRSSDVLGMITIYNSIGELVYRATSENASEKIDISYLKAGIYTVEILGKHIRVIKE